jgi:BirA family biotin operon repressor/biotin-[acetyl-CoA-carboxylase] ligase
MLKWPNDVLVSGAKMAGILLERSGDAVVVGIGVNLAQAPEVPDRATFALADLGIALDPDQFANDLAECCIRSAWRSYGLAR